MIFYIYQYPAVILLIVTEMLFVFWTEFCLGAADFFVLISAFIMYGHTLRLPIRVFQVYPKALFAYGRRNRNIRAMSISAFAIFSEIKATSLLDWFHSKFRSLSGYYCAVYWHILDVNMHSLLHKEKALAFVIFEILHFWKSLAALCHAQHWCSCSYFHYPAYITVRIPAI